jgi:hypothetical protein
MLEINVFRAAGIGCYRIRIGRTFVLLILTFVSSFHFH